MRILVAIDSSEFSKTVIDEVGARPWPAKTVAVIMTVIDSAALASSIGYLEPFIKNEYKAARALVESAASKLSSRGLETITQLVDGHPGARIVEEAKKWTVDFVFLGSHGHSGFARFFIGSIAKEVLRSAHCSVEVVRCSDDQSTTSKRVLLATDGSEFSAAAARSIAERPWPKETELRIASIVDQMIPAIDPCYAAGDLIDRALMENQRLSEDAVSSATELVANSGLRTTTCVLPGTPKWRLLEEAKEWKADLIVLGSHGRRGFTRLLLGSVSEAVALNAPCSVEVIRSAELLAKDANVAS